MDIPEDYVPALRTYERGGRITGVTICPGNSVSMVAYDKREELSTHIDGRKREWEESLWTEAGWDGTSAVARVEFRFRAEALHELGARDDLDKLPEKLDELWKYATLGGERVNKKGETYFAAPWVRLIAKKNSRRANCRTDDRWKVVQAHYFEHNCKAAKRNRLRSGASSELVFGASLSRLASEGSMPRLAPFRSVYDGEPIADSEGIAQLDTAEAAMCLKSELAKHLASLTDPIANDFIARHRGSPHDALDFVRQRSRSAVARFSGEDNGTEQCKVLTA